MGAAVISRLLFTTAKSSDNGTKAPSGNRVLMTFTPFSKGNRGWLRFGQSNGSPFAFLVLSCLRHASSGVLVHVLLSLHAHPLSDATHDVDLPM